eukprot:TRINITY_DN37191_c0_g3_i1.p1 TRINITY_DN37191_c0_g3~~TRINITY_DN37191_c0_g3_i1.p1  ORF type:complete len:769 (-),score=109.03 TRINITY_DN37191_c0_g3_i1:429-2735(-)
MPSSKPVAICQFGGVFVPNDDGSMFYSGGEAHAIPVDRSMTFDEFKSDLADNLNCDISTLSIKYFLPTNRRTLITISNDKGLQRMVDFHEGSDTIDVYILPGEVVTPITPNKVDPRSKRTETRPTIKATRAIARAATRSSARLKSKNTDADLITTSVGTAPAFSDVVQTSSAEQLGAISTYDSVITGVGQEFHSAREFRFALRKYAIAKGFVLQYLKNDSVRVTVKCKADGCPWRVHASRLPKMQKFTLRKINDEHTCSGDVGKDGHPQATEFWIASVVKDKLRDNPQYKPREIANDILRDYGIKLKYQKVWRGREVAMEQLQALRADLYSQLPSLCGRIRETNPGSNVTLATTDESRFHRLFISFHASIYGFENGCRPLLFLNGISLRDKYPGTLLAASSVDGEDGIFPVAFAIVDDETYDNWHWFLTELKSSVSANRAITFVSDRINGLEEAVPKVFRDSYHGFSLNHLIEDYKRQLTGLYSQPVKEAMIEEFKRAAHTCRIPDFNVCIHTMRNVSHDVAAWVLSSKYEQWSNAFFKGERYNCYSSDVAESFYCSWIREADNLTILQVVDMVLCKTMEMICTRREASSTWSTTLAPSHEEKLQVEIFNSRGLNVLISSETVFEVRDNLVNIVNIETWDCTCRQWKISGLPCIHAVAVLDRTGRNIYDFCSRYLTVDSYRATYSESINPIATGEKPACDESTPAVICKPPLRRLSRPPGRPRQKRAEAQVVRKSLKPRYCSRCKGTGHNKKTCKELNIESATPLQLE